MEGVSHSFGKQGIHSLFLLLHFIQHGEPVSHLAQALQQGMKVSATQKWFKKGKARNISWSHGERSRKMFLYSTDTSVCLGVLFFPSASSCYWIMQEIPPSHSLALYYCLLPITTAACVGRIEGFFAFGSGFWIHKIYLRKELPGVVGAMELMELWTFRDSSSRTTELRRVSQFSLGIAGIMGHVLIWLFCSRRIPFALPFQMFSLVS